eukprot:scaffold321291_cov26-Tisochrysis_lutea.AAC.4
MRPERTPACFSVSRKQPSWPSRWMSSSIDTCSGPPSPRIDPANKGARRRKKAVGEEELFGCVSHIGETEVSRAHEPAEERRRACRVGRAWERVVQLGEKVVGEGGVSVSGCERRRLAGRRRCGGGEGVRGNGWRE